MSKGQPAPNLKARRLTASLTADQLAQRSGLSLRSVLRAESAAELGSTGTVLSVSDLERLAVVLSTTAADLRGF